MTDTPEQIADELTEAEADEILNGLTGGDVTRDLGRKGLCLFMSSHFAFDNPEKPGVLIPAGWRFRPAGTAVLKVLQSRKAS